MDAFPRHPARRSARLAQRLIPLLVAAAHVAVAVTPCTPISLEEVAHEGHSHFVVEHASSAAAEAPVVKTPCPCGCDERSGAPLTSRVGWAELPSAEITPHFAPWSLRVAGAPATPGSPDLRSDPIPI